MLKKNTKTFLGYKPPEKWNNFIQILDYGLFVYANTYETAYSQRQPFFS